MEVVTSATKRPVVLIGAFLILFAAFAGLLLRVLPRERRPVDYMVAGTFATALALVAVLLLALHRRS